MPDAREQAEAVARWCGWKRTGSYWQPWRNPKGRMVYRVPPYADSLDAMREVETELSKRGHFRRYREVLKTMWNEDLTRMDFGEYLVRLTALQRLAAAAKVIEEVGNAG